MGHGLDLCDKSSGMGNMRWGECRGNGPYGRRIKKSQEENCECFPPDFVINGRDASLADYRLSFRL